MKKITIFNTAVGSLNVGDYIINESGKVALADIIARAFVVEYPTHVPVIHSYQSFSKNTHVKYTDASDYKFVLGTNLLAYNNLRPWPNWNVNIFNYRPYRGLVLAGVGSAPNADKINFYTKFLYKKILSKDYIHSTRDEKTKVLLESIGLRAVNTGCVTLWGFNSEICAEIPTKKSARVVFTLTDYARDIEKDSSLIAILRKNYNKVFFWPQGSDDFDYIQELGSEGLEIIAPQLDAYRNLLSSGDIDFVGTRLHAGIFAMQNRVRSLILIVDNRARDIQQNYNVNAVERADIDELEAKINSDFVTDIRIDENKIAEWKAQFSK